MTAVELGRVVDGVGGGLGVGVQEGVVVGEVVEVVGEGGEREGGFACAGGAGEERGAVVVADRAGVDEVVSGLGEREVQRGAKGGGAFPPGDGVVVGDAVQDCVLGAVVEGDGAGGGVVDGEDLVGGGAGDQSGGADLLGGPGVGDRRVEGGGGFPEVDRDVGLAGGGLAAAGERGQEGVG
jgi:hypothetical protein